MRLARLIPSAVFALMLSGGALAQGEWAEFVDREDHFLVNFPGNPSREDISYKTVKGTTLPGRVYKARDQYGNYNMTVVNYQTASEEEFASAIEDASKAVRAKGKVTHEDRGGLDGHTNNRITVETPDSRRLLAVVLTSREKRLYISEADTGLDAPPPALYQASLQVLDDEGVRIRYRNQNSNERVR
jgi:hypothetical protein